ncbi:hypothetical protein DFJ74DRAFT_664177 [Hyaloraphidium curvatum]|nr:hypothetical protein DFJ74DRAFT_664177 [Hyaloraphidium curvatum]
MPLVNMAARHGCLLFHSPTLHPPSLCMHSALISSTAPSSAPCPRTASPRPTPSPKSVGSASVPENTADPRRYRAASHAPPVRERSSSAARQDEAERRTRLESTRGGCAERRARRRAVGACSRRRENARGPAPSRASAAQSSSSREASTAACAYAASSRPWGSPFKVKSRSADEGIQGPWPFHPAGGGGSIEIAECNSSRMASREHIRRATLAA